ncbi:hypothetical protein KYE035_47960 [Escherichia coli]
MQNRGLICLYLRLRAEGPYTLRGKFKIGRQILLNTIHRLLEIRGREDAT